MASILLQKLKKINFFFTGGLILLALLVCMNFGYTQNRITVRLAAEIGAAQNNLEFKGQLHFSNSGGASLYAQIPLYEVMLPIGRENAQSVAIYKTYYSKQLSSIGENFPAETEPQIMIYTIFSRDQNYAKITFPPGRSAGNGQFQILDSIELSYELGAVLSPRANPPAFKPESVLKAGNMYKIATGDEGVYKITSGQLSKMGINTSGLDPKKIRLFCTQAGSLPELNDADRTDDLEEIAIYIKGGDDGVWNNEDEIWFYSPGPHRWILQGDSIRMRQTNIYTDKKYFFVQTGEVNGKRISMRTGPITSEVTIVQYNDATRYEVDEYNLLKDEKEVGGGKLWFGDLYYNAFRSKDYTDALKISNTVAGTIANVKVGFASRCAIGTKLSVIADGSTFSRTFNGISLTGDNVVADYRTSASNFISDGGSMNIKLDYPQAAGYESKGWLDFIEVNSIRKLIKEDGMLKFGVLKPGFEQLKYAISGLSQQNTIWDITDLFNIGMYPFQLTGDLATFNANYSLSNQFVAFSPADIKSVETLQKVAAQNIHASATPALLVIYNENFRQEALEFASFRAAASGIIVNAYEVNEVYNEFSGGAQDPSAIRDLARMYYSRDPQKFKSLLLFGNGSFDYRDIGIRTKRYSFNTNFVPVYEYESTILHPISSFPLDDYFGYLDSGEGIPGQSGMDIGVGRFPVSSANEAATVVNKIKSYTTARESFNDWRNDILLISDDFDESYDNFGVQSENLGNAIAKLDGNLNIKKIFADLYKQENLGQGERYPDVVKSINDAMNKGVLIANYIGHGGPDKLADEEIIDRQSVSSWNNQFQLPLFVTGTCSFSIFDDPTIFSLGRDCIIRPNGGMIGLITTVRAVYISENERIINTLFTNLLMKNGQEHLSLGQSLKNTKNQQGGDDSKRFALLGDPSMVLNFPKQKIVIESFNNKVIGQDPIDTLKALQKVSMTGSVRNTGDGIDQNFNGTATVTVFDKSSYQLTRGNDGNGANIKIKVQNNSLFHGKATVSGGKFSVEFIVPKDINYSIDSGRISVYAENGTSDAGGFTHKFFVGGESSDPIQDNMPPVITLYLNNYNFKSGQTVNNTPLLIAKLSDDNGINISGSSIGHDIVAKFSSNDQAEKKLNDYYVANKDDYKAGEVTYQLDKLAAGEYTLQLRAWDIANNKSEAQIDFIVTDNEANAISRVLNYPNPFTDATSFMFEYDSQNQPVEAQISIYTVSGKLVKTIREQLSPVGKRFKTTIWNGRDDYDGQLAKGVYLYKVKLSNAAGARNTYVKSDFQKLVLLK